MDLMFDVCDLCACVRVQNGGSCLHIACQQGHLSVVQYLYQQGGQALLMLTMNVSLFVFCDILLLLSVMFV